MKRFDQLGSLGALLLTLSLIGYAVYELVLYPGAGFPTKNVEIIIAGADTLRVGHSLKFSYALSVALLVVGLYPRVQNAAPLLAPLATIAGVSAVVLFLASGRLGLRILDVAELTYSTDPSEAITTILLRTVTIALFEAATFAVGWYALLINVAAVQAGWLPRPLALVGMALGVLYLVDVALPDALQLVAPLVSIVWAAWLALMLWRDVASPEAPAVVQS